MFIVALFATQAYYFVRIACWRVFDPSSTAFMRAGAWRMRHEGDTRPLQHQWVPYDAISKELKRAVIASEDDTFANNDGYSIDGMRRAWEKNQRRGEIVAGGSTISQQLARNLFLSPERSYLRKAEELVITGMLELMLDKRRILELYLNSVEWGNGVYGAEAAAQHYYGGSAARLTRWQAARLAVMLPRPRYFDAHRQSAYLAERTSVIARRMGAAVLPN
nr:monofunctional biosynthetic peptidoglycan transglycosylase [Chitinasiproducens palmae]